MSAVVLNSIFTCAACGTGKTRGCPSTPGSAFRNANVAKPCSGRNVGIAGCTAPMAPTGARRYSSLAPPALTDPYVLRLAFVVPMESACP